MKNDTNKKIQTSIMMFTLTIVMFFPLMNLECADYTSPSDWNNIGWWNPEWPYRKLVTINYTKVSANLINFPVLLSLSSDMELAEKAQPMAQDLVFVWYDNNLTVLAHEIEFFNNTTGQLIAWINITFMSGATDTRFWMYYGNPTCDAQENITDTWESNYVLVQHLNETGTVMYDSTAYHNDGASNGTTFTANGKIDGGHVYNDNDKIVINNFTNSPNALTLEVWVYRDNTSFIYIACKGIQALTSTDWILYLRNNQPADNGIDFSIKNHSSYIRKGDTPVGCWFYLTATYENGNAALYFNGTQIGSATGWPSIPNNYPHLGLGNDYTGYAGGTYPMTNVKLDEVRVSKIARNASWISTSYSNQNDPESFCSVGAEERYEYTLTTSSIPSEGGIIIVSPDPPYYYNDLVLLTAIPNPGYLFDQWGGDLTGNENPALLLIDGNKSITAFFLFENNPPVALNDSATVLENSSNNTIDVLANDYDPDGDNLTITIVTQPISGASFHDGSYVYYTPDIGYTGSDFFTYNISDGQGGFDSAAVNITVLPLNSPPYPPSEPNPENGESNVSIMVNLEWIGGDPDPDDIVLYDVYFGATPTPVLVSANQSATTYDPVLTYGVTYYWRIVSWDTHNASTEGELWQFTTETEEQPEVTVNITRPLENSFYLRNRRLFPLPGTVIIYGPITITAEVTADSEIARVEFYIDGRLKKTDLIQPYTYRWAPILCFKHVITVKAFDTESHMASDEITVFKWRMHPLLLWSGAYLLQGLIK